MLDARPGFIIKFLKRSLIVLFRNFNWFNVENAYGQSYKIGVKNTV
jgi:hypothetical protein